MLSNKAWAVKAWTLESGLSLTWVLPLTSCVSYDPTSLSLSFFICKGGQCSFAFMLVRRIQQDNVRREPSTLQAHHCDWFTPTNIFLTLEKPHNPGRGGQGLTLSADCTHLGDRAAIPGISHPHPRRDENVVAEQKKKKE